MERSMRPGTLRVPVAVLCLVWLTVGGLAPAAPPPGGPELAPLWDGAVKALRESANDEAARQFTQWIEEARRQGIESPEAHYNLGLALWAAKRPAKAVFHLVESARLRSSPLSALKVIATIGGMQKELGIREPVSEGFGFRLYFFLNPDWTLAFSSLGFWLVVTAILLWWLRGKSAARAQAGCLVSAALFTLLAVAGAINRRYISTFAVLDGDREVIPVYAKPEDKEDDKLVDLPAGTLVSYGRAEGDFRTVSRPVAGWVPASAVRPIGR